MITDPLFYLVAIPAVLLVGLAKGGFGGALTLASDFDRVEVPREKKVLPPAAPPP